jgi:hypothetical protein
MDAFSTDHLNLYESGVVMLAAMPNAYLFDSIELGFVGWHHWPAELGPEPDWLWSEIRQCIDWWEAAFVTPERPEISDRRAMLALHHP